jgi:hypothetical protein
MATQLRSGVLLLLLAVSLSSLAQAQVGPKTNTVSATVPLVGMVVSKSALARGDREPTGDLWVNGTVTTTTNGAYKLQARLSSAISDTVKAKSPPSMALTKLSTTTWVTIVEGAAGINKVNQVSFLVVWGKNSPKKPETAEAIPVEYQIVP